MKTMIVCLIFFLSHNKLHAADSDDLTQKLDFLEKEVESKKETCEEYIKNIQTIKTLKKEKRELKKRKNAETSVLKYLKDMTKIEWLDDKKYYLNDEARLATDPIESKEVAEKIVEEMKKSCGTGEYAKSPNGNYYRVFISKESIINILLDPGLGYRPAPGDLSNFFKKPKK